MGNERAERAAGDLADGVAVDWPAEKSGAATDEERVFIRRLAQIADAAAACENPAAVGAVLTSLAASRPGEGWGGFRLIERLGGGSYGEVFRARDPASIVTWP